MMLRFDKGLEFCGLHDTLFCQALSFWNWFEQVTLNGFRRLLHQNLLQCVFLIDRVRHHLQFKRLDAGALFVDV